VFAERYEVVRCVGVGGMGAVYECIHRGTKRHRALKVLHPGLMTDQGARERFAQEACITAKLDSKHLVDVFDAGVDEETDSPYIVMELLKGYSLGQRLEERKGFTVEEVLEVLGQVASVLDQTQAAGIVHRDLKPDNLFATPRSDGGMHIKILDFGIAKAVTQLGQNRNTVNIGTPLYMAPEQVDGTQLDHRADLFSLAHIAYELLTGENYWEHELKTLPGTMALLRAMDRGFPEPASVRAAKCGIHLGASFDDWFFRAVARDPNARFPTAAELVGGFAEAVGEPMALPTIEMVIPAEFWANNPRRSPTPVRSAPGVALPPHPAMVTGGERTTNRIPATTPTDGSGSNPKSTGGPGVWGMVTPHTARRANRTVAGVAAIVLVLLAGVALAALALRGSGDGKAAAPARADEPAAAEGTAAIRFEPAKSAESLAAAAPAPVASASMGIVASASASATAKVSKPPSTAKPSQRDLCRSNPRRCR
jgi:serine/threonine protein kinase